MNTPLCFNDVLAYDGRPDPVIERDGKYYLRGALHYNYLYSNSGVLESSESLPSTANSITIDDDNHILTHNGADIFVVDTTNDINKVKTVSVASLPNANYRPLEMFKLQLNSSSSMAGTVEDTLNAFKTTFYEKTANYKNGVTPENWTTLTNNFNSLS